MAYVQTAAFLGFFLSALPSGMYHGVPAVCGAAAEARVLSPLSPKPISTGPRAGLKRISPDLTPLCVMPFSWTKARVEAITSKTRRGSAAVPEK